MIRAESSILESVQIVGGVAIAAAEKNCFKSKLSYYSLQFTAELNFNFW